MGLEEPQGTSPEELSPVQAQLLGWWLDENIPRSASAHGDSSGNEGFHLCTSSMAPPKMLCSHPTVFPAQGTNREACRGGFNPSTFSPGLRGHSQLLSPCPEAHEEAASLSRYRETFPSPLQAALRTSGWAQKEEDALESSLD